MNNFFFWFCFLLLCIFLVDHDDDNTYNYNVLARWWWWSLSEILFSIISQSQIRLSLVMKIYEWEINDHVHVRLIQNYIEFVSKWYSILIFASEGMRSNILHVVQLQWECSGGSIDNINISIIVKPVRIRILIYTNIIWMAASPQQYSFSHQNHNLWIFFIASFKCIKNGMQCSQRTCVCS